MVVVFDRSSFGFLFEVLFIVCASMILSFDSHMLPPSIRAKCEMLKSSYGLGLVSFYRMCDTCIFLRVLSYFKSCGRSALREK
jgi:hypothetical protein